MQYFHDHNHTLIAFPGWSLAKKSNGQEGWAPSAYLREEAPQTMVTLGNDSPNYESIYAMPTSTPDYAVQRQLPAGPLPVGPYTMNPGSWHPNSVAPFPHPYPAYQPTPTTKSNSLNNASIYPMPGTTSSNSVPQATDVAEGDPVSYMGYLIPGFTSSNSAPRTMPVVGGGSTIHRKVNPTAVAAPLDSAAQARLAMQNVSTNNRATIPPALEFVPRAESPTPRYSQPVFCHLMKGPLLRAPEGQAVRPTLHLWPLSQIRKFKGDLNNTEDQALCYSKNVLHDLSNALHVFEVRIEVEREKREVELCRYFVPSSQIESKYIEIHPKDVCLGLNPAGARIGQMEQAVTQVMFECGCSKRRGLCHGLPRIISLLNNHLLKAPISKLPPRPVSGEWYVGGRSKQWGLSLDEARNIWSAEAGRLGPNNR